MRKVLALMRAGWLAAASYRVRTLLSLGSVLLMVVPLYLVANALQPVMADAIRAEGSQYFGFLLIGMIAFSFVPVSVQGLPTTIGSGISSGVLEALFTTPTRLPTLLAGLTSYGYLWTTLRAMLMLAAGAVLGVPVDWARLPQGLLVLALIVLAHVPFGLIAAGLMVTVRTTGPFPQAVLALSGLLGGVYYPTHVIPSWIQAVSALMPLTYGLRALRRTVLEGLPLRAVAADLWILAGMTVVLFAVASVAFAWSVRYARRAGTLAQY